MAQVGTELFIFAVNTFCYIFNNHFQQLSVGCGLINKRRNCFMNATLQALFRIPKIASFLQVDLDNANRCKIQDCISCMVLKLYGNVKYGQVACSPYHLYSALTMIKNSRFSALLNGQHQDAHEFLMVLNYELEKQVHPARWFTNSFTINLTTHIECGSCGKVHQSFSEITDIALHVVGNKTVQAAVDSYFHHDDIEYMCETCRTYDIVKKKHFILSAPECLCLQLRRFSDRGTKLTDEMEISSKLNIRKHFLKAQPSEWKYKLVAIVNHFGESRNIGHYNTIVLTSNEELYEFDDRSVRKVSSSLISGKDAYMLFYELIEVIEINQCLRVMNSIVIIRIVTTTFLNIKESTNCDLLIDETSSNNNDNFDEQQRANGDYPSSNETFDPDEIRTNPIQNQTEVTAYSFVFFYATTKRTTWYCYCSSIKQYLN